MHSNGILTLDTQCVHPLRQLYPFLSYNHTEHQVERQVACQAAHQVACQAAAARSHRNTFATQLANPNGSQNHCLNLPLSLTLPLDARCGYTLSFASIYDKNGKVEVHLVSNFIY